MNGITKDNFFTASDGARIFFEQAGQGHALLMMPGFPCTTRFFRRNIPELSKKYRVISFDPRGQGYSSKTCAGNTVLRNAQDIKELMEHLDLRDVTLLGWSMACSISVTYATQLDEGRLKGLILVDGSLYPLSAESWNKHRARDYDLDSWMDTYLPMQHDFQLFMDKFISRISNDRMSEEDRKWVTAECRMTMPWTALEVHYDFCHTDNVQNLCRIQVPVAFFGGASKAYGLDMIHEYQRRVKVPSTICEFWESGHMLAYYEAEKFNAAVSDFIESLGWPEQV